MNLKPPDPSNPLAVGLQKVSKIDMRTVFDGDPCPHCSLTFTSREAVELHCFQAHRWGYDPNTKHDSMDFMLPPKPQNTACKHGHDQCELCGTTNRRDALHTTVRGLGRVGALRGKR